MEVHTTADVEEYRAAAEAFLKAEPCARNVLLTVMDMVRASRATYSAPPSFWWVTDSGAVVGAASWTPPNNLLVSSMPAEASVPLAAAAIERATALGMRPRGVVGPAASARAVAAAWTALTDDAIAVDRPILLNELGTLTEVAVPDGRSPSRCPRRRAGDRPVARGLQRGDRAHRAGGLPGDG